MQRAASEAGGERSERNKELELPDEDTMPNARLLFQRAE
jgi:hypothetical protein